MNRRITLAALILLGTLAAAMAFIPGASAQADGLVIEQDTSIETQTLTVYGELRVTNGATLTLRGATVELWRGANTAPALVVEHGAALVVQDSILRAGDMSDPFYFQVQGQAQVERSRLAGLAADPLRAVGGALEGGFRVPWGGLAVDGGAVSLTAVSIQGTHGCAVAVSGGSVLLDRVSFQGVEPRVADGQAFAAGVCARGGRLTLQGIDATGFALAAAGSQPLRLAGVVATDGASVTVSGFSSRGFAISGVEPAWDAAFVFQDAGDVHVEDVDLEHVGAGLLYNHGAGAFGAPALTASRMSMWVLADSPVSVSGTWSSSAAFNFNNLSIDTCPTYGVYFLSTSSSAQVDVTVDNVTVTNCNSAGIYLSAQSGSNAAIHNFNVISSNSSNNGGEGIYFRGDSNQAGLNALCGWSSAWWNQLTGIRVTTNYVAPSFASATAKIDFCTANNNTQRDEDTQGGGFELNLGAPNTMAIRYNNNTASGNGFTSTTIPQFGHWIYVQVRSSLVIIPTIWMNGLVGDENGRYGLVILGGAGAASRFEYGKVRDSRFVGNQVGAHVENGRLELWNSVMDNPTELEGILSDFVLAGTEHNRLAGATTGAARFIYSFKQVAIHAQWQNGRTIADTLLVFRNGTGSSAAIYSSLLPIQSASNVRTDVNGNWSGWVLDWIFDPTLPASQGNKNNYAPVSVGVQPVSNALMAPPYDLRTNIVGSIEFQDIETPNILVLSPRDGGVSTKAWLNITGQVVDEFSGVARLEVSLDGGNWTTIPTSGGTFAYTLGNLSDGVIDRLYLRAWDRANDGLPGRNETVVILNGIVIDTQAPALNLFTPDLDDGGIAFTSEETILFQGSVEATVQDLFLNGERINHTGDIFLETRTLVNEGPQTFLFLAIDGAGNAARMTITIVKDTFAPTLIITSPQVTGDLYVKTRSIALSGITDAYVDLKANGVSVTVYNLTFTTVVTLNEGRNAIVLSARDPAGNAVTRTIVVYSDTITPVITVESPQEGATLNNSRVLISGTVSEVLQYITVNQRIVPVGTMLWEASFALNEGPNSLEILAIDRAGNIGTLTLNLFVDTRAPDLQLIGVRDGLITNDGTLTVSGSVTEAGEVTINGVVVSSGTLDFQDTVNLVEGDNIVTISARDSAGNAKTIVLVIRLDTGQPTIAVTQPRQGETVNDRLVQIVGTAEPNSSVEIGTQVIQVDAQGQFVAYVALDKFGQNSIVLTVTDEAGNTKQQTLSINYASAQVDTTGSLITSAAIAGALVAGLGLGGRFVAKRSVDRKVKAFRSNQPAAGPGGPSEPGYTEAPQEYAPPPAYAPQEYGAPPYQEPPATPPPRPPRPPRPPTN